MTRPVLIYDAKHNLKSVVDENGNIVAAPALSPSTSSTDPVVLKARDITLRAVDFVEQEFGVDLFDRGERPLHVIVNSGVPTPSMDTVNNCLVLGAGDSVKWDPAIMTSLPDAAHELAHRADVVKARPTCLTHERGAISDAMAYIAQSAAEGDNWHLMDKIYTPGISGDAFVYLDDPASNGFADFYPERYGGEEDGGGVHLNSTIIGLAYFLLSMGGKHPQKKTTVDVPKIGSKLARQIFFGALSRLEPNADLVGYRAATIQEAGNHGRSAVDAVTAAWEAVGVPVKATPPLPGPANQDPAQATLIEPDKPLSGIKVYTRDSLFYKVKIPEGATNVRVRLRCEGAGGLVAGVPTSTWTPAEESYVTGSFARIPDTLLDTMPYADQSLLYWKPPAGELLIRVFGRNAMGSGTLEVTYDQSPTPSEGVFLRAAAGVELDAKECDVVPRSGLDTNSLNMVQLDVPQGTASMKLESYGAGKILLGHGRMPDEKENDRSLTGDEWNAQTFVHEVANPAAGRWWLWLSKANDADRLSLKVTYLDSHGREISPTP